jgi:hypothetical protein
MRPSTQSSFEKVTKSDKRWDSPFVTFYHFLGCTIVCDASWCAMPCSMRCILVCRAALKRWQKVIQGEIHLLSLFVTFRHFLSPLNTSHGLLIRLPSHLVYPVGTIWSYTISCKHHLTSASSNRLSILSVLFLLDPICHDAILDVYYIRSSQYPSFQ